MMKMVPASRRVTDASLVPPSRRPAIARSRANAPAGEAAVDWVSVTAKAGFPNAPRGGGDGPIYQRNVNIRLDGPSFRGMRSMNLRCAVAHRGTLRFSDVQLHIVVRCFASPR